MRPVKARPTKEQIRIAARFGRAAQAVAPKAPSETTPNKIDWKKAWRLAAVRYLHEAFAVYSPTLPEPTPKHNRLMRCYFRCRARATRYA